MLLCRCESSLPNGKAPSQSSRKTEPSPYLTPPSPLIDYMSQIIIQRERDENVGYFNGKTVSEPGDNSRGGQLGYGWMHMDVQ